MPDQNEKNQNENGKTTIDVSAKTVDEAIDSGLAQLELTREQVEIEIVKEGKRGVFGIGSEEAHVRLTPKVRSAATPAPPSDVFAPVEAVESTTAEPPSIEEAIPAAEPPPQTRVAEATPQQDVEKIGVVYLSGLLERMGIQAKVSARIASDLVEPGEEPPLVLDITGADLGILIGRRSETLRALQYMLRLMVSKQLSRWYPLVVDVESYRVRRRRSLHQLADKMAERAVSRDRKVVLEAMPAYERRIIHLALRNHPQVVTKSVGSDDNRKVTIIPK